MRKVLRSNSEAIHVFAQRTQNEGRNATSSVFFNNMDVIYSYGHHYELGRFLDDNTILINDTGYSVSTSKHIGILRYATSHYKQFFTTETDLKTVYAEIMYNINKLASARKPELYISPILRLWASLNEFIDYTKNKETKKTIEYKEIKRTVKALNENSEDFKAKLHILAVNQAKAKKKKDAKQLKESLAKFNAYEVNSFRIGSEDYLRLSKDGTQVETSQNIAVSVENAKLLYSMIKRNIDIVGHKIDYYTVTSINGTLKIGCHNINIESMHEVGSKL